ncbi:MAG: DUF3179 domain-containing (seleno)protein [Candidatus Limnocylindria bacterium]
MRLHVVMVIAVILSACSSATPDPTQPDTNELEPSAVDPLWPSVPPASTGDLDPSVGDAVDRLLGAFVDGSFDSEALDVVAASGDARLGWIVSDLLRFVPAGLTEQSLVDAFTDLTGVDARADERFGPSNWQAVTNLMIGWDLPEPPRYRERKASLFLRVEPGWAQFFADEDADIDWRWVSWGGVLIDDRPLGNQAPCPRGCIPALDDPSVTSAADGAWYPDDRMVFGVVVDDEAVAFPKHIMEVHEMVNLTIGSRRVGMPYCTLCSSAQAYLTDEVPSGVETPVLRTSGLLSRSNKLMYDLVTGSAINTFTGRALSGPLQEAGLVLEQVTVVVTTWGEWRAAHPDTRIVAQDGGIGRDYPLDPLGGRDDDGPIFPIGQVDPRLPAQTQVLGVIGPDDRPVAFAVDQAATALAAGETVSVGGVEVHADGGGLRARTSGGSELAVHQSFWFAWSQFHPGTALWTGLDPVPAATDPVAATPDPRAAFVAAMCPALAGLGRLEATLDTARAGHGEGSAILAAARSARDPITAVPSWRGGDGLRAAMLASLDAIAAALRGGAEIPHITTDRVESELQSAMAGGFSC